jgi:hypothetical protein
MENFFAEWGLEVLIAITSAAILGWIKYKHSKLKQKLNNYEELLNTEREHKQEEEIEIKLEPIYEELEELRAYIREAENIEKAHMTLIIASYRFRLIQLCKEFLKQGYMTYTQYEQLTEFFKLYTGLGGNGQAKAYYERTIILPIRSED